MHREAPITMFIGAKNMDNVRRSRLNRRFDEHAGVKVERLWTGNTVDPRSDEVVTWAEVDFSSPPMSVGASISEVPPTLLCGVGIAGG